VSTGMGRLTPLDCESDSGSWADGAERPVLVCLLGSFRLLKLGRPVSVRSGGKTEALLYTLALSRARGVSRDALLDAVWPGGDPALAAQSLNTLVYGLRKLLGDAIGGATPVLHEDGCYRLNAAAGVGVDTAWFDALASAGEQAAREGDGPRAVRCFSQAASLYHGDLSIGVDVDALVERERLRSRYLTLLARLADHHFERQDFAACLNRALQLLAIDPCREDAHRLAMRCYARRGQRGQALRQYRLCERVLSAEFDATPEPATAALFDRLRLDPASI
jgi:DNA-binding SARP family transcriptional activator